MAGSINPNINLNLDQQASFNVANPVDVLRDITQQNNAAEIAREKNFQSGLNNTVSQAAASVRQQQADQAQLARQLEAEEFKRQERIATEAFARQQLLEQMKLDAQKTNSDITRDIKFNEHSLKESQSLAQHRENLIAMKLDKEAAAAQNGFSDNKKFRSSMEFLDKQIEAADLALGLTQPEPEAQISAGITGFSSEQEPEFQAVDGSSLMADEMQVPESILAEGVNPLTETLPGQEIDPVIQKMADGLKLTFEEKKAETLASLTENVAKSTPPKPITDESVEQTAREVFEGKQPTAEEIKVFKQQEKVRKIALNSTDGAKTDFVKKLTAYNDNTSSLFDVDENAADLEEALTFAKSKGVEIDINAQSTLRALTDKLIDSEDNEGAQELLNEIKAVNIFKFPANVSQEERQAIQNKYLTGLDQITGSSSFIARGAGNTGVLTAKDVQFAMKRYISLNGNMDQFIDNLHKGRAATAAAQMRQGYLYHNDTATKGWKDKLDSLGYKINSNGTAVKAGGENSLEVMFGADSVPSKPEEVEGYNDASDARKSLFLKMNDLGDN